MTVIFAGPYGTMFLADMGAETIRVETLNHLPATSRGPFARPNKESQLTAISSPYPDRDPGDRPWNRASNFNAHSRNKSGMTLELGQPEAKDIFRRLVEVSDLFIENNAAGSMARLGVSWDVVSKWNPRLIMISVCGFGQTGPWSEYRGIGTQFEAAVGHASVSGYPDMGIDGAPGSVATDASSGVTVAIAAMLALHQREKTGKGMYIDISLGENFLPHLGELYMDYTINGRGCGASGQPRLVARAGRLPLRRRRRVDCFDHRPPRAVARPLPTDGKARPPGGRPLRQYERPSRPPRRG